MDTGQPVANVILGQRGPTTGGRIVWTMTSAQPELDANGNVTGVVVSFVDIGERKTAEDALRQSESRYRSLLSNLRLGVMVLDAAGYIRIVNSSARDILQLWSEEPEGAHASVLNPFWLNEDGEAYEVGKGPISTAVRNKMPIRGVVLGYNIPAGEERRWMELDVEPELDGNGEVHQVTCTIVDITERKTATDALTRSEERYRNLINGIRVGVMVLDGERRIRLLNEAAQEILRTPRERAEGRPTGEFNPQWFDEDFVSYPAGQGPVSLAINDREISRGIVLGFRPRGEEEPVWVEWDIDPEYDEAGQLRQVVCTVVDVTERKAVRDAIAASESRFRSLLETLHVGVFVLDSERRIRLLNQAASEILRTSRKETEGRPLREFASRWFDSQFVPLEAGTGPIAQAATSLKPVQGTILGFRPPGASDDTWIELDVVPEVGEHGQLKQIVCTILDVTERKRAQDALQASEARFRSLVEGLRVGIVVTSPGGTILMVNRAASEIVDAPARELIGRDATSFAERWYDEQGNALTYDTFPIAQLLTDQQPVRGAILGFRDRRSGQHTWVMVDGDLERDDSGEVRQALYSVTDVTARVDAEQERRAMERQLFEAQKFESLGVLAGGVAHDFNNLLTGVLANAEFALLDLPADSPARESIREISTAAQRAADLSRQMLTYSGRGQLSSGAIDLNDVVREIRLLLRSTTSRKIDLSLRLADDLPHAHADATQVRQVLMNLVTNAADAIGDEPGTIAISTGVMDATRAYFDETYLSPPLRDGRFVFFEVRDNGPGMDAATSRRVFEPFFTTKFTGRGLGMSSAVGLIRAGLGAVHLQTQPGAGTTFRVLLPLANTPASVEPARPTRHDGGLGPGTVLVAEDEATVRKVVTRSLESFGLTPLLAADGREAIERFIQDQDIIDCVLLDLTMPRLSGREALAAIREVRPDIPVVLMSGFTGEDIGVDLEQSGARFLQKPFEVEELRAMLAAVLRQG